MDQKIIKEYIRALEHMTGFMRLLLEEELKNPPMPANERERITEITNLRLLAKTEKWPQAVPEDLICGEDEDQKLARAAGIVHDFIKTDLTNQKFLDFGCGEGHVPYVAANLIGVSNAVGYDIEDQKWDHFDKTPNLQFTQDFELVKKNGPYDTILVSDVIDHVEDIPAILKQIKEVKAEKAKIFMRCHPWTSRHGTHIYKQINKAYAHLIFDEDELYSLGIKETTTNKLLDPLTTYRKLISQAGLMIVNEEIITHPVELFFTHESSVLRRIKQRWVNSDNQLLATGKEFPRDILEIQFVDFLLI